MTAKPTTNAKQIASLFGCTEDQVRNLKKRNAEQLTKMAIKAEVSGQKVNGYTAQQLRAYADKASKC